MGVSMKVFHRDEELDALRKRIASRKSFLLHGPAGVGKTLLLEHLAPEFPDLLYCPQSRSSQAVFQALAAALVVKKDATILSVLGPHPPEAVRERTAVGLKGIVASVFRHKQYIVVLDHLIRPSHSLAAAARELMIGSSIPVVAVARSAHMEDAGFIAPLFPDRGDRLAIKNFEPEAARGLIRLLAEEQNLAVENFAEFLSRVVEFSGGNPGAIASMVKMASMDQYRLGNHVKLSPLYIDFRLQSQAVSSER